LEIFKNYLTVSLLGVYLLFADPFITDLLQSYSKGVDVFCPWGRKTWHASVVRPHRLLFPPLWTENNTEPHCLAIYDSRICDSKMSVIRLMIC